MSTRALPTIPVRGASLAAALAALLLAGCAVFSSPEREYASNAAVLAAIEGRIHYRVDEKAFRLVRAEVDDDSITLHYLGVENPGDRAWVVRFSEKSTELAPERLATVAPAIAVIEGEDLQPGFDPAAPAEVEVSGVRLEAASYTFRSSLAPAGRSGRGLLAALRRTERGESVVYQIKLDNHGDRDRLPPAALAPFIEALPVR